MADSLGILQQYGSPSIDTLVQILSDHKNDVYTVTATSNTGTTITLDKTYSLFLVWSRWTYSSYYSSAEFFIVVPPQVVTFCGDYASVTINANSITGKAINGNHSSTTTVLGIV